MELFPKIHTIWYITFICNLKLMKVNLVLHMRPFEGKKDVPTPVIENWDFYCLICIPYLLPFQNCIKLVCSLFQCRDTECDTSMHGWTDAMWIKCYLGFTKLEFEPDSSSKASQALLSWRTQVEQSGYADLESLSWAIICRNRQS